MVTTAGLAPLAGPELPRRNVLVPSPGETPRGMGCSIAAGVAERSASPG